MEHQIGQEITINARHNIKVVVCEHRNCDGCFFIYKCKTDNREDVKNAYGECSCLERKDGKNIIFLPVSDNGMKFNTDKAVVNIPMYFQETDSYEVGSKVWFASDLHLFHDREFIWRARGFKDIDEMNAEIEKRWNETVGKNDHVYVLGDLMLGGVSNKGIDTLKRLNGNIHIVIGNHDTDNRLALYRMLPNVKSVTFAAKVKYGGYNFFLTHFPCLTGNIEKESLKQMSLNLSGHTHSKDKFFYDLPYVYNVAMDAHNCTPVSVDEIITDMIAKVEECKNEL